DRRRRVDVVGIGWGAGHVVNLPPAEVGALDGPVPAGAVRGQRECALLGADQHPYSSHAHPFVTDGRCLPAARSPIPIHRPPPFYPTGTTIRRRPRRRPSGATTIRGDDHPGRRPSRADAV